jgi:hypothetical protein
MFVSQNSRNDYIEAVDIRNATTANCRVITSQRRAAPSWPSPLGGQEGRSPSVGAGDSNSYSCGVKTVPYAVLDSGSWTLGMHFGKVYDPSKKGWLFMNTYDSSYATWGKNQNLLVQVNDWTKRRSRIVRLGPTYNLHHDYRSEGAGSLDFKGDNIWMTANWGYTDGRGDVFRVQLPDGPWPPALIGPGR